MTRKGAIGGELRALRMARRLSLVEAARRTGIARSTLHRWESTDQAPGVRDLAALLAVLEADPRERARLLTTADPFHAPTGPVASVLATSPLGLPVHPGHLLRALRERRGLTQGDLARSVGLSGAAVQKWEAGRAMPSGEPLRRALATLDAEGLGLRGGSLDLYEPLRDPEEARARVHRFNPQRDPAQSTVGLLALQRELWTLAARDARWEAPLAEALSRRAWAHHELGEHTLALEAAGRALRLARSNGGWDPVWMAVVVMVAISYRRGSDNLRAARPYAEYVERARDPVARACVFAIWENLARLPDPPLARRLFEQGRDAVEGGRTGPYAGYPDWTTVHASEIDDWAMSHYAFAGDLKPATEIFERRSASEWEGRMVGEDLYVALSYLVLYEAMDEVPPDAAIAIIDHRRRVTPSESEKWVLSTWSDWLGLDPLPAPRPR